MLTEIIPSSIIPNLGGPGWIEDIIKARIKFTSPYATTVRHFLAPETALPLFTTSMPVTGYVELTAPPRCKVWYGGIKAKFDCVIHFHDDLGRTHEEREETIDLAPAGEVEGTILIPFILNMKGMPGTFDGDIFSIRHNLSCTISRPWYTFDVWTEAEQFAYQRLEDAGDTTHAIVRYVAPTEPTDASGVKRLLNLEDFPTGGPHIPIPEVACVLDCGKTLFELNESIDCQIVFVGNQWAEKPYHVTQVVLVLLKFETVEEEQYEFVVQEWPVYDSSRDGAPPITDKIELHQVIDLSHMAIAVSFEVFDKSASVCVAGVKYMLRLHVSDSEGDEYWNSHDISLYRTGPTCLLSEAIDTSNIVVHA